MPKYFMNNTHLSAAERQMMTPPGFLPRGGGQASGTYRYKPEDVACKYCKEYRRRKCTVPVCPYIPERLDVRQISYQEVVRCCFHGMSHRLLSARIEQVACDRTFGFLDEAHYHRLQGCLHGELSEPDCVPLAALYLLTADQALWALTAPSIRAKPVVDTAIRIGSLNSRQRILFQVARGFNIEMLLLAPDALTDPSRTDDDTLWLIINASILARYGKGVMKLEGRV